MSAGYMEVGPLRASDDRLFARALYNVFDCVELVFSNIAKE